MSDEPVVLGLLCSILKSVCGVLLDGIVYMLVSLLLVSIEHVRSVSSLLPRLSHVLRFYSFGIVERDSVFDSVWMAEASRLVETEPFNEVYFGILLSLGLDKRRVS